MIRNQKYWFIVIGLWACFAFPAISQESTKDLESSINSARNSGNITKAEQLTETLLSRAREDNSPIVEADAFYHQALNAMERNSYPPAQALLNSAIAIYQDQSQQVKLGHAYRQLGLTYRYQSDYPTALEYIYASKQIFEQHGSKQAISSSYNSIGVVLEKMGQYEEATQAHQKALEIDYELGDVQGIASGLYNLGDLRRSMGDNELALKYFNDALAQDIKSGNKKNIAYSHNKIGFMFNNMGDYENARVHLEEALKLFRAIEAPRDTDWALTNIASLELNLGNFDKAKSIVEGVIERAIENGYKSLLVDAYEVAAQIAYEMKDYPAALEAIEKGLAQALAINEKAREATFEELRVKVHLANDSLQEAFNALQRQKLLDDKMVNDKRLDAIARVQAQTEFVRRAHQIELLEKEKALQDVIVEQERLARNFWITVLLAASVLVFLLYSRVLQARVNKKLEKQVAERTVELERKNNELALAYQEVEAISVTDKLTGIHNRRFLENHLQTDLELCYRAYQDWWSGKTAEPDQSDIVLFICDLDNFKRVNDQYGHNAGDKVICEFAQRMANVFRHSDYLIRWGGEEFVAVARFVKRSDAEVLAQRLLEIVNSSPFELSDGRYETQTCSIGYVCYPPSKGALMESNLPGLMGLADACLYYVKENGKDNWLGISDVGDEALLNLEKGKNNWKEVLANDNLTLSRPQSLPENNKA